MIDIREHGGAFGGGSSKLNVFTGSIEPKKKEGIWIKTETKITQIINDLELWFSQSWNDEALKKYATFPSPITLISCAVIENKVYLIASPSAAYVYDSVNDIITPIASLPVGAALGGTSTAVGNKVYYFSNNNSYVYDPNTNKWNQLKNIPVTALGYSSTTVGKKIYVMGGYTAAGVSCTYNYVYDTETDTWQSLAPIPYKVYYHQAVKVGTKIYINGGYNGANVLNQNHFYDTETNTWTQLAPIPYNIYNHTMVAVGTKLYVIGGSISSSGISTNKFYIYNIETNAWTQLSNLAYINSGSAGAFCNGGIYLFGGETYPNKIMKYSFNSKVYANGTVILYRIKEDKGLYNTELVTPNKPLLGINTRMVSHFDNVYIYENNNLKENPVVYYGNGKQWVQFKG